MKHSQILELIEQQIKEPLRVISVERVNIITFEKKEEKFSGLTIAPGDYAMVDVRLLVPITSS